MSHVKGLPIEMIDYEKEQKVVREMNKYASVKGTFTKPASIEKLSNLCYKALSFSQTNYEALGYLAKIAGTSHNYERVIIIATEGINAAQEANVNSHNLEKLHYRRGYALFKQERYQEAVDDLNTAVQLGYRKPKLHYIRMNALLKQKNIGAAYDDALIVLSDPKSQNRKFPDAVFGEYLFQQQRYEDSRRFFQRSNSIQNKTVCMQRLIEIEHLSKNDEACYDQWKKFSRHLNQASDAKRAVMEYLQKKLRKDHLDNATMCFGRHHVSEAITHLQYCVLYSSSKHKLSNEELLLKQFESSRMEEAITKQLAEKQVTLELVKSYLHLMLHIAHCALKHETLARTYLCRVRSCNSIQL
jgi:tetratricopeptide (TPR) repeat protein